MSSRLSSVVLKEINIPNNEDHSKLTFNLPDMWWTTTNTYDNLIPKKAPVIFPLITERQRIQRHTPLPKVNNWEIKQGDYIIKDRFKQFRDIKKRRSQYNTLMFVLFTVFAGLTVMFLTRMLLP